MRAARVLVAFAIAASVAFGFPGTLRAQSPAPQDDCALIGVQEAGAIIGLAVNGPDEATQRQGHCLFTSQKMSKDGSVLYGFVRAAQVPQLEQYYKAMLRTCAGLVPGAPREGFCKTIERLSNAGDIDAYYAARTGIPSAHPAPQLGANAVASGDGVFVRRDDYVLEAIVIRDQEVDVARSLTLAQLLLQRLEPKLH